MDKIIMPRKLTAENGAKTLLIGEFFEEIEVDNPDYRGCGNKSGNCDYCREFPDEPPTTMQRVDISWTNIKEIYKIAVKHLGKEISG